jgi:hypothetical protein
VIIYIYIFFGKNLKLLNANATRRTYVHISNSVTKIIWDLEFVMGKVIVNPQLFEAFGTGGKFIGHKDLIW